MDLGIEIRFCDGMDTYARTWLQFAFPICIWGVIGTIMFVSSQSKCEFLVVDAGGRTLNRSKYGSGEYCEPLLDAQ